MTKFIKYNTIQSVKEIYFTDCFYDRMVNMEKILELTLLYDFYGQLLTPKQQQIFDMYYLNDLSLSEIAEPLGISRQAVRDSLKHSKNLLQEYESKLLLVDKFLKQKAIVEQIFDIVDKAENMASNKMIEHLNAIKQLAGMIIE